MTSTVLTFLPLARALVGLLFFAGLALTWGDPSSETSPSETFSHWRDNRGQHQISGLLLAPSGRVPARLLRRRTAAATAAGQRRLRPRSGRLRRRNPRSCGIRTRGHAGSRGDERRPRRPATAVYTLSQLHSYDWLAWNAAFAAMLLATGLGARRNEMLPTPLAGNDRHRSITPDPSDSSGSSSFRSG